MKLKLVVCCLLLSGIVSAQEFPYDVTTDSRIFFPFFDGIKLINTVWDDPSLKFNATFPLEIMGEEYTKIHITPEGTGGSIQFSDINGNSTYIALSVVDLMDRGRAIPPKPLSAIRHKTIGTTGNREFIIQYYNVGFANPITDLGDGSDFIHMQLRFYEADGVIEVCYGARNLPNYNRIISDTQGNTIAFFDEFNSNYYQESMFYLTNTPANPQVSFVQDGIAASDLWQEEPAEDQVIRFTPRMSGVRNNIVDFDQHFTFKQSANEIVIESLLTGDEFTVSSFDVQGKMMQMATQRSTNHQINTSDWPTGMYVLTIESEHGPASKKIFVSQN